MSAKYTAILNVKSPNAQLDRDPETEESRKYRRTVFTFERWAHHRSSRRHWRHVVGLFESRIASSLLTPVSVTLSIALVGCLYELGLKEAGVLPDYFPSVAVQVKEPLNYTSFALSLLLVFRTNASYARWLEARKLWGGVLNRTRDLVRQGLTYLPESSPQGRQQLARWTIAFPKALMCHLRVDGDLEKELQGILERAELEALLRSAHRPNFVLQALSSVIGAAGPGLPTPAVFVMDQNLTFFADALGACERILKTPIPLSYTRHTSRFLIIWLTFLPFTLIRQCGWATIPVSCIISFLLLAIEEIGVQIEEPFGILALEAICESSEKNIREEEAQAAGVADMMRLRDEAVPVSSNGAQDSPSEDPVIVPLPSAKGFAANIRAARQN